MVPAWHTFQSMSGYRSEPVLSDYREALRKRRFETTAVGIRSAEGWHERYDWDDAKLSAAVAGLAPSSLWAQKDADAPPCAGLETECARHAARRSPAVAGGATRV